MTRINTFIHSHSSNRVEYLRVAVYICSIVMIVLLAPLHLVGVMGIQHPVMRILTAIWLVGELILAALWLFGKKDLEKIFFASALFAQTVTSVRIFLLITGNEQSATMMVSVNLALSYIIVLLSVMGMLRKIPILCTAINLLTCIAASFFFWKPAYTEMLIFYGFMEIITCCYSALSIHLIDDANRELADYSTTLDQVLHVFNMSKTELVSLLQVMRNSKTGGLQSPEALAKLTYQTKQNITHAAEELEAMKVRENGDLHKRYPQLSESELLVSRLVAEGKTLKEIAAELGKSTSNVSTVRGNIRKKLGLSPDDDLKKILRQKN